ncbi:MAG: imidazole glycerol phosphate synthase subunit HisH [Nitrososphaerales archaeon]
MKIALLDYGVGNLYSISCALNRLNADVKIVSKVKEGLGYDALILPGVGNFTPVAERLGEEREVICNYINSGRPLLGICLGLQILFDESEEGEGKGLNIIPGRVLKLPNSVKIPHIGWNKLSVVRSHEFVDGIPEGAWVYFVHSYYPSPNDVDVRLAETEYGIRFPSIVGRGALVGTQFHPEKSAETGRLLLKNFIKMVRR